MLRRARDNPDLGPGAVRLWVTAFFALGLLQILNHALWQDEWQAWLLARDSGSLVELFRNLRYEGHPALWYLPLFGLSRFTAHPLAMQLLHLALATAAVYIFLRWSPFTRLQKILFIFGYFPFFEYAVISRNYALGVLLIFTYCAVFPRTFPKQLLVLAGLLFLLCQTSVYGVLAALALGAALFFGELTENRALLPRKRYELLAALGILGAGVGLALLQLMPPPDSGFAPDWRFNLDWPVVLRTMGSVWDSFVPLPGLHDYHFWNTNIISQPYVKFCLSLLLLALAVRLVRRRPAALVLFGLGSLALLSFTYTKYPGSLRHHGHLYILFIAACWLAATSPASPEQSGVKPGLVMGAPKHRQAWITALFSAQLAAGLLAAALALYYPFSAGRETAAFIQANGGSEMLLAGDEDDAAAVLSGYLRRPLYYLCAQRWGTFVIWDQQRKALEVPEAVQRARDLAARHRQEVLLVLNREIKAPEPGVIPLRQFTRSMVPAEAFYLYILKYPVQTR